jgi:adenine-specific DNA-methyltransferase
MPTLNWIGKQAVEKHHLEIPYRLLEYDESLSAGDQESGNLLIQGDNLHALKALLPYYAGKVKCIYIDPPYNTGEEKWIYNDNVNSPEMKAWLNNVVGEEDDDLSRHDKWLCMLYPRLQLLNKLLHKDGVIFISIDDNEVHNLRSLCDEIFGINKFIATVVWQKRYSRENRAAIGDVHEYIMIYSKNPKAFKEYRNTVPPDDKQLKVYKNPNNDPKGRWRPIPMTAQAGHATPDQFYAITTPSGKIHKPPAGRCWSLSETTYKQLLSEGRIYFGKKGNSQPNVIRYITEVEGFVPWTWWPHEEVGNTDEAKKEMQIYFGNKAAFDNPKPLRLLARIIRFATNKNDIILDSFAGSGTTAHAILQANKIDNGNRKFILVEMDKSICTDVTKIRLNKVINGHTSVKTNGSTEQIDGLGSGFRFCKLSEPLFDRYGNVREGVKFNELARHVYFSETGSPISEKAKLNTPKIGTYKGIAYYLLFNGILGDKTVNGGNVLTSKILEKLPKHNGPKIIFGEANRLGSDRLKKENIIFKQIPYEIKTS